MIATDKNRLNGVKQLLAKNQKLDRPRRAPKLPFNLAENEDLNEDARNLIKIVLEHREFSKLKSTCSSNTNANANVKATAKANANVNENRNNR